MRGSRSYSDIHLSVCLSAAEEPCVLVHDFLREAGVDGVDELLRGLDVGLSLKIVTCVLEQLAGVIDVLGAHSDRVHRMNGLFDIG